MRNRKVLLFLLVWLSVGATGLLAQTFRGGISGSVVDQSGGVVAQVEIVATNDSTGVAFKTISSSAGDFWFQDLPLGSYTVKLFVPGFEKLQINNISVSAGKLYNLPIKLAIARGVTTVEVSASAISLDTTSAAQDSVIASHTVQDMPVNGRDFTQMIALSPGFTGYNNYSGSVNGTRENQINWQIEGADNNDAWQNYVAVNQSGVNGIPGVVMPLDAIEEFSSQTLGGSEIGRNPGGTVNLVIKSGSNQLHGSAYYYNRNEALAAQSPFAPPDTPKNKLRNQHYGFSLGGPIVKEKTFFFATYEEQKFVIGNQARATEPSGAYQAEALNLLQTYGVPLNSVSENLLSGLWPADVLTGPASPNNYFNPNSSTGYSHNGLVKLDHNFNDKNRLSFRVFLGQGAQVAPEGSDISNYYQAVPTHAQNYSLIFNTILSPTLTNQVTAGVNYFRQTFADADLNFDPVALGLNTGSTLPGAPNINIDGFDAIGLTEFSGRTDVTGNLMDTVSYVVGRHQLRFGGEFRKGQVDVDYNFGRRGAFEFTGANGPWGPLLGNPNVDSNVLSLSDFLAGYVDNSSIVQGDPERLVYVNSFALFAQDAWQVTRQLNLNYGLRYDYVDPLHDDKKDLALFDPSGNGQNGLAVAGSEISSIYPPDRRNLSPRVGFAYQPRKAGNLVVRGSYGIFFDTFPMGIFLDNSTRNHGPLGVSGNPAGSNPVYTVEENLYTLELNQPIFPTGNVPISGSNVINLFSVNQNLRTPYTEMYSLNIEQSFGANWIFQVGYVGSQGRKLPVIVDVNQAALGSGFNSTIVTGPNGYPFSYQQGSRPYFLQFPNFGVIDEVRSAGTSNYNGLQASVRSKDWHGLSSQFAYAWSHNLDEFSVGRQLALPQDSTNLRGDYGNSSYDQRHHFTGIATYDVPGSHYGPKWLSHGWQLNTVLAFHTGPPFTVRAVGDPSGTGERSTRANQVGDPYAGVSHELVDYSYVQWVNPAAFSQPANGTFGTMRRNQVYGPGFGDMDLSIFKNIPIKERLRAQFRIEMFNLFNRVNLAPPSTTIGPGFGQSSDTIGDYNGAPGIGAGEPFNVQFALKILF